MRSRIYIDHGRDARCDAPHQRESQMSNYFSAQNSEFSYLICAAYLDEAIEIATQTLELDLEGDDETEPYRVVKVERADLTAEEIAEADAVYDRHKAAIAQYLITNTQGGDLGVFQGVTAWAAYAAMLHDAGYSAPAADPTREGLGDGEYPVGIKVIKVS